MSTIFLSYARGDDEPFVRRLYDDLTKANFEVWFDRINMPSRGLNFHQEIRDAITDRDCLLLVVGPQAINSEYVRQEWQFAWFDAEKVITPILRLGDYPLPIPELALLHCEDFRNDTEYPAHLEKLIRVLREPAPPMGKVIGAPALPANFLTRTDRLISLRDALRSGLDSPAPLGGTALHHQFHGIASVSRQVGLHGMGGIGKSVLANLLAHDREVRKAFPDGIVWIGLGSLPNITSLMQRVHQQLGGDGLFATEYEGQHKLKEILANKAALLVIDDVWRRQDVDAFNVLGPRCRALITTRDAGLLTAIGGTNHLLQLLTDDEALRLLAVAVGVEPASLPSEAHDVMAECGRLPLAIALAGGMAKNGISWSDIRDALQEHDLEYISDEHRSEAQHRSLWRMIEVSVNALTAEEQLRLVELGVFPEHATVPEAAITTLWESTGRLNPRNARKLLTKFKQRSLIQVVEESGSSIARTGDDRFLLHGLIHDYCVARHSISNGDLKSLHSQLLGAYQTKAPHGWWSGPNDGYYFQNLRHHLISSGRDDEAVALLMDFSWLQAKTHAGLIYGITQEMFEAGHSSDLKSPDGIGPWYHFVRAMPQFLHQYPNYFFQQALNQPFLSPVSREAAKRVGKTDEPRRWLEWRNRPHEFQPPICQQVWLGDRSFGGVALSPDGRIAISGSSYGAVEVWDVAAGRCTAILQGHTEQINTVALSADGRIGVSGSHDGTLRIWNLETLTCAYVLTPQYHHKGRYHEVWSVALSADGRTIVSGGGDGTVRVWAGENYECQTILDGHTREVWGVAVSADGRTALSGSEDKSVRVWDLASNTCSAMFNEHSDFVSCVAISPCGRMGYSGSWDFSVRVWNLQSADCQQVLVGHTGPVSALAVSQDGNSLVTGGDDNTIRIWDLRVGSCVQILEGHTDWVNAVSFGAGGHIALSASSDSTIRVWDLKSINDSKASDGHTGWLKSIAISADGLFAVSEGGDDTVRCWDISTCCCNEVYSKGSMQANQLIDAVWQTWTDEDIKRSGNTRCRVENSQLVMEQQDGEVIVRFPGFFLVTDPDFPGEPFAVAASSADGKRIVVGDTYGKVYFLELHDRESEQPATGS